MYTNFFILASGFRCFWKLGSIRKRVRWNRRLIEASLHLLYWGFKKIPFTLYTYVLAKILQNGAKFMQNLTPGFKNHIRNLNNFRQSVESPKSGNFMSFCPKNKFLHLKNYQRIYLTILSTTCVKIHQTAYVNFHDTTPLYLF